MNRFRARNYLACFLVIVGLVSAEALAGEGEEAERGGVDPNGAGYAWGVLDVCVARRLIEDIQMQLTATHTAGITLQQIQSLILAIVTTIEYVQDGLYEWGGDVGAPYIDQLRGLEEISDCLMTVEGGQAVEMDAWMYGVQTLARIYNALTVLLEHLDTGVIRQDHEELKQGLQNLFDDKLQAALEEENVWRAFNSGEQLYIDAAFAFLEEDRVNEAAGATPILLDPLNEQALLGGKPVPKLLQKKRLYPYPMGSCTVEARQFGFLF